MVHLFLPEVRAKYELEKLWSLGPEQDEQYQAMLEDDKFSEIFKNAKLDDFFVNDDIRNEPGQWGSEIDEVFPINFNGGMGLVG